MLALRCVGDKLVTVHADGGIGFYRWIVAADFNEGLPFTIKFDRVKNLPSSGLFASDSHLRGQHTLPQPQLSPAHHHGLTSLTPQFQSRRSIVKDDEPSGNCLENDDNLSGRPRFLSASGDPITQPLSHGGVLSSWRSAFRGLTTRSSSITTQPPLQAAPETLYNAMRIERRNSQSMPSALSNSISSLSSQLTPRRSSISSHVMSTTLPVTRTLSSKQVSLSLCDLLTQSRLLSCGYWDNAFKLHNLESMKEVCSQTVGHLGGVTVLGQSSSVQSNSNFFSSSNTNYYSSSGSASAAYTAQQLLLSGGVDGTIRVWILEKPMLATSIKQNQFQTETLSEDLVGFLTTNTSISGSTAGGGLSTATPSMSGVSSPSGLSSDCSSGSAIECLHVLHGHSSAVQCLSFCSDMDVVLSGGSDGLLCLHTVRQGAFVRCMYEFLGSAVDVVLAASSGHLLAHSWATQQLGLYWMNGEHMLTVTTDDK
jgi:hypothetical protein